MVGRLESIKLLGHVILSWLAGSLVGWLAGYQYCWLVVSMICFPASKTNFTDTKTLFPETGTCAWAGELAAQVIG